MEAWIAEAKALLAELVAVPSVSAEVELRSRERVGVKPSDVLKLDDYRGFHPNLGKLREVYGFGNPLIVA